MTPSQVAELLTYCAAYDRRTIGKADVVAWHRILRDLRYEDAEQAVADHYTTETRWVMPADIREAVARIRTERIAAANLVYDGDPDADPVESAEQLRALVREAGDGQLPARPIRAALEPGEPTEQPTGRAHAILASVGHTLPRAREGVVNVLAVPCPRCSAQQGRTCTTGTRRRADAHPARLEDARRAAAGLPPMAPEDGRRELERRLEAARAALDGIDPADIDPADDFDPVHRVKPKEADAS